MNPASEWAIELVDATVDLGDYRALDRVSLRLPAGASLAILGPNGAGKSTLLRALLGLLRPTTGSARVFGVEPSKAPAGWIGYVPQVKTLDRRFPALAIELVATGTHPRWPWRLGATGRAAAMAALDRVGAAKLADKRVGHLSGGELQRVYLARAVARHPKLILLDEPAAGIDATGEADMFRVLEKCRVELGATIAMVTHDWGAALHHATRVLALNRRVVGFGPPAETLTEACLRETFGHVGHSHAMAFGGAVAASAAAKQAGASSCGHDHAGHDHAGHDHGDHAPSDSQSAEEGKEGPCCKH